MAKRHPQQTEISAKESLAPQGRPAYGRYPYSRPRIVHRELLEAMASDCSIPGGKADASCVLGYS